MKTVKSFPNLYKITKSKYTWCIEVVEDDSKYFIKTAHGTIGGKQVPHLKEVKRAKSKDTIKNQAIFEAKAKWQKKKDEDGYSTDSSKATIIIRPMLAHTFDMKKLDKPGRAVNIKLPCFGQPKYDGIRCVTHFNGKEIIMKTRKGKPFHFMEHIRKDCLKVIKKKFKGSHNWYLDGEIYTPDLTFQQITGLCRLSKTVSEKDAINMKKLKYCIYDCFNTDDLSIPFSKRVMLIASFPKTKTICKVPTTLIKTKEEIEPLHDMFVSEGFEGLMLRNMDSPYQIDKRSKHLQKYKKFVDSEYEITGFKEGKGDAKGTVVWQCVTESGKSFSVRPVGTTAHKKKLFENGDDYIGKLLTVVYQELTDAGLPRFPVGKAIRDPDY
tara:strand:+ start:1977 stop:3119 length:1143 start_codon:yes stop_codon:yes gene_type:complete